MAWVNLSFNFGAVLSASQMTQLDDNFEALAQGQSGAPQIRTNAIQNASVTAPKLNSSAVTTPKLASGAARRSKIGTNLISYSGVLAGASGVAILLNAYSLFPMVHASGISMTGSGVDGFSADAPRFTLVRTGQFGQTPYNVDCRNIST